MGFQLMLFNSNSGSVEFKCCQEKGYRIALSKRVPCGLVLPDFVRVSYSNLLSRELFVQKLRIGVGEPVQVRTNIVQNQVVFEAGREYYQFPTLAVASRSRELLTHISSNWTKTAFKKTDTVEIELLWDASPNTLSEATVVNLFRNYPVTFVLEGRGHVDPS